MEQSVKSLSSLYWFAFSMSAIAVCVWLIAYIRQSSWLNALNVSVLLISLVCWFIVLYRRRRSRNGRTRPSG